MLYTIMPIDLVLDEKQAENNYLEKSINGNLVQLNKNDDNYSVMRIISTNPKAFLDKKFQPGNFIKL